MSAVVLRGDARNLPLPDASVDLIVTSPPYFGLRDYRDGDASLAGQIGAEPTPREYVAALLECTAEWMRVLKPEGSIFVDLGDKYDGEKSLMFLPERYRIACRDELGLIGRAVLIWSKPNGLPESVTDRVRRSHEDWVHLTKQPRYFSAVDEIREAYGENSHPGRKDGRPSPATAAAQGARPMGAGLTQLVGNITVRNPLGKLPGSVWEIATQPLKVPDHLAVDHFAAFPMEWPRRIISGWSPSGICTACGEGRRPVTEKTRTPLQKVHNGRSTMQPGRGAGANWEGYTVPHSTTATITGYACACPDATAPTRPAAVLDPFGGTGTVALVADTLGRHGVSVDRSADYCRLAAWRTTAPAERARALGVPKPPPVIDGQGDLFGEGAA